MVLWCITSWGVLLRTLRATHDVVGTSLGIGRADGQYSPPSIQLSLESICACVLDDLDLVDGEQSDVGDMDLYLVGVTLGVLALSVVTVLELLDLEFKAVLV